MKRTASTKRPHVTAMLLTIGNYGYAWAGYAMKLDAWEKEPIETTGQPGSAHWNAAAFAACLKAYQRLRQRVPAVDMSLCTADPPAGAALPIVEITSNSMTTLRRLIPELLPPVTQLPKE